MCLECQLQHILFCAQEKGKCGELLSPYSTRTQNIWRRVLLRYLTQKVVLLRHLTQGYQHVGIFWPIPDANPKICVTPDANPRRQSVEYRWRWASGVGAGVGHVHFMFFVLISFAFCSQRKPSFRWNMGFNVRISEHHNS